MGQVHSTRTPRTLGAAAALIVPLAVAALAYFVFHDPNAPLVYAVQNSDVAEVKRLLDRGDNPNARLNHTVWWRINDILAFCSEGELQPTLLMIATQNDRADIANLLINHHADLELRDARDGWTALEWATEHGSARVERILLDRGAHMDDVDPTGGSAVTSAAAYGNFECLKMLVEHGAKLTTSPGLTDTPLAAAKRAGDKEMIAYLRQHHSS